MISYWLLAAAATSVAAGIYTLATRQLPPIFPDGQRGRGAPEIDPADAPRWGLGFVAFGVVMILISFWSVASRP